MHFPKYLKVGDRSPVSPDSDGSQDDSTKSNNNNNDDHSKQWMANIYFVTVSVIWTHILKFNSYPNQYNPV